MDFYLKRCPAAVADAFYETEAKHAISHYERIIKDAYAIKQLMSGKIFEKLVNDFAPLPIRYQGCKESMHPYLSALSHYSYYYIHKIIGSQPFIDIGARTTQFMRYYNQGSHACILLNNPKDEARLNFYQSMNQAKINDKTTDPFEKIKNDARRKLINCCQYRKNNEVMCLNGILKCQHKANVAIAIHSAYDIPINDWPLIFENNELTTAYLALHIPDELLHFDEMIDPDNNYRIQKINKKKFAFNCPNDPSLSYVHEYANVRAYLLQSVIKGRRFDIVMEICKIVGPMKIIKLTRSTMRGFIHRTLDIRTFDNLVEIPVLSDIIKNEYKIENCPSFRVDKNKLFHTIEFALSLKGDSFSLERITTYVVSVKSKIAIGKTTIQVNWPITPDEVINVSAIVYLYVYIKKMAQKEDMHTILKHFHEGQHEKPWFRRFLEFVQKYTGWKLITSDTSFDQRTTSNLINWTLSTMNKVYQKQTTEITTSHKIGDFIPNNITFDKLPIVPKFKIEPLKHSSVTIKIEKYRYDFRLFLTSLSDCKEQSYYDLCLAAYNNVNNGKPVDAHVKVINGVAGCGKTTSYKHLGYQVITPTAALKDQLKSEGLHAMTPHVALKEIKLNSIKTIVVDECYRFPIPYFLALSALGVKEIYAFGDPKQITYIDYAKIFDGLINPVTLFGNYYHQTTSYRCPKDVTYFLKKFYNIPISTKSELTNSIKWCKGLKVSKTAQNLTFTSAMRDYFKKEHPTAKVMTVDSAQGHTFKKCVLLVTNDSRKLLDQNKSQVYVALTRHTDKLVIRSEKGDAHVRLGILDTNFEINMWNYVLPPVDHYIEQEQQITLVSEQIAEPVTRLTDVAPEMIVPIIDKVMPNELGKTSVRNVTNLHMPPNYDKLVLNMRNFNKPRDKQIESRSHFSKPYTLLYNAANPYQTLSTALARYSDLAKNYTENQIDTESSRMLANFRKCLKKNIVKITTDKMYLAMKEYIESLEDKEYAKRLDEVMHLASTMYSDKMVVIQHFLKTIEKLKVEPNYPLSSKPGQGISAWGPTFNSILCVLFRSVEMCLIESLKDEIVFANGLNDNQLAMIFNASNFNQFTDQAIECDFSKFDKSQDLLTQAFTRKVLKLFGLHSDEILDLYFEHCANWTLNQPTLFKLSGQAKKHSGEPGTLLNNTTLNMAIITSLFEFEDIKLLLFKGDDSLMLCRSYKINEPFERLLKETVQLPTKIFTGKVPQFCGLFFAAGTCVYDLLRAATRLGSANIMDLDRFKEMKQAAKDWFQTINSDSDITIAASCVELYYGLDPGDGELLYSYVERFSRMSYDTYLEESTYRDDLEFNAYAYNPEHNPKPTPPYQRPFVKGEHVIGKLEAILDNQQVFSKTIQSTKIDSINYESTPRSSISSDSDNQFNQFLSITRQSGSSSSELSWISQASDYRSDN